MVQGQKPHTAQAGDVHFSNPMQRFPPSLPSSEQLTLVRRQMRARRRAVAEEERVRSAGQLTERLCALSAFADARRLAAYWARDGEAETAPLCQRAWALGKQVFLPVLTDDEQHSMLFALFERNTELVANRFGIPEPRISPAGCVPGQDLDLVLAPLVAFAENGARIGMGGGFYDRAFAFRRDAANGGKPRLLGLAFEFQKVDGLPSQPWDVPLDGIVTEHAYYPGIIQGVDAPRMNT